MNCSHNVILCNNKGGETQLPCSFDLLGGLKGSFLPLVDHPSRKFLKESVAQCYCSIQMLLWLSQRFVQVNDVEVDPGLLSVLCTSNLKVSFIKSQFVCYIHGVTFFKGEVIQVKEASYPIDASFT